MNSLVLQESQHRTYEKGPAAKSPRVGWLVDRWVGLVGWLIGRLVDWLVGLFVGLLVDWLVGWLICARHPVGRRKVYVFIGDL